jgi:sensor domain CHASE-containing protein
MNILFYIVIAIGVAGIVSVLIWLYRKSIRKQMQKEMKMQVAASVEHYFALTEVK